MKNAISEDLKEMLSYRETLSLVCFNVNYAGRFETMTIENLSVMLNIAEDRLEKALRILRRIGMAKTGYEQGQLVIEMTEPVNDVVKNTIFEVLCEKQPEYTAIYKTMVHEELPYGLQ